MVEELTAKKLIDRLKGHVLVLEDEHQMLKRLKISDCGARQLGITSLEILISFIEEEIQKYEKEKEAPNAKTQ